MRSEPQTTMKIWLQIEIAMFWSSISNSTTFNLCISLHVLPHFSSEALSALDLHTWTWSLKLEHVWKSNSLGLPSQQSACLPNNGLYSGNKLLLCHFCTFCTHYNKPTWHILHLAHFFQSHFIIFNCFRDRALLWMDDLGGFQQTVAWPCAGWGCLGGEFFFRGLWKDSEVNHI